MARQDLTPSAELCVRVHARARFCAVPSKKLPTVSITMSRPPSMIRWSSMKLPSICSRWVILRVRQAAESWRLTNLHLQLRSTSCPRMSDSKRSSMVFRQIGGGDQRSVKTQAGVGLVVIDIIKPFLLPCSTSRDNCAFPKHDVLAILLPFHQLHLFAIVAITSTIDCP